MRYIALSCLLLGGCASSPYWVQTWEGADAPPTIVVVDLVPASYGHVHGWTQCDRPARKCTVFLRPGVDRDCVLRHELEHVAGRDHPEYPASFACTAAFDLLRASHR